MIIYNRTSYKELTLKSYQKEKRRLQIELLKLQEWVINSGQRLAIVLEGRDAAGKGATIIYLDPSQKIATNTNGVEGR